MGRGRAKGKKLSIANNHDDPGSGEEEKIPAQKRRGRPQKPLRDDIDEDEVAKIEEDDLENNKHNDNKNSTTAKDSSVVTTAAAATTITAGGENGKKRKRNVQAKERPSTTPPSDDNGVVVAATRSTITATTTTTTTGSADGSIKTTNGFRHIGSRRKNKPRRAAEVGVECK